MWHMSVARTEIAAKAPPAGGCNLCSFSKMPKLSSGASRVAIFGGLGGGRVKFKFVARIFMEKKNREKLTNRFVTCKSRHNIYIKLN